MNKIFEQEWALYQMGNWSHPSFRGVEPHVGATGFDAPVRVGEIRIFADMNRPFVALILSAEGVFGFRIVPVSPFTVPASAREMLVGSRVYQLWNACTAAKTFVEHSWIVDTLEVADVAEMAAAIEKVPSGAISENEKAAAYERAFRVAGGDFRFLLSLPRVMRAAWRRRMAWGVAAMLMICCGIGELWYGRHLHHDVREDMPHATRIEECARRVEEPLATVDESILCAEEESVEIAIPGEAIIKEHISVPTAAAPIMPDSTEVDKSPVTIRGMSGTRSPGVRGSGVRGKYRVGCAASEYKSPLPQLSNSLNCETYAAVNENEFRDPKDNPLSTFGLDVDTTSYTLMRHALVERKQLPDKRSVRIEEFVNYFKYDYPQPKGDDPVAVDCELAVCPWNAQHKLLRLGVQARKVDETKLPPCNLTFLVDVSGSMEGPDRIGLLKRALKMLVGRLRANDHVAIVTYADQTHIALPSTCGSEKTMIDRVIDGLGAGGCTAGGDGIQRAYEEAGKNFDKKANNRVILVTDGDFNVGISSPAELERFIATKRDSGIFLTVLGVGDGNYKDASMKKLANAGNGNYAYLDSLLEAKKVMLNEFCGTMMTVAKDVKVQVEFNPGEVGFYRLLGYENRKLAARDFNDDKKDAGEMGADHTMTAFYEIIPTGVADANVDTLKYQKKKEKTDRPVDACDELCTVKLRWKAPHGDVSTRRELPLRAADITRKEPSEDFRFASAVAECALILGDSTYKGAASFTNVLERARNAKGVDREGYRAEFIRLVERAELFDMSKRGKESAIEIDVDI